MKIIVEVSGGNVVAVYADEPIVEVLVADRDNQKAGGELMGQVIVENLSKFER